MSTAIYSKSNFKGGKKKKPTNQGNEKVGKQNVEIVMNNQNYARSLAKELTDKKNEKV